MNPPALEISSAAQWLKALDRVFFAAERACGTESILLELFQHRVRLQLAGPALRERLVPAFAHLIRVGDHQPVHLTVKVWDGASSRMSAPPPPWPLSSYAARSEVRHGFTDCPLEVSFQTETGTLEVFAAQTGTAYCWVRDVTKWPLWQSAAPLRTTLGHFARTVSGQLVHGAAVGTTDGAVLLSARGGSGKSTTALAGLFAQLLYLGDDYVFLDRAVKPDEAGRSSKRRVFGVYATAKLRRTDAFERIPKLALAPWHHEASEPKSVLYLHPLWKDRLAVSLPLRALLIPFLSAEGKTRVHPAAPQEALHALAPTTIFQLPGSNSAVFRALADFVRDIPVYRLELGPRPQDAVALIRQLLGGGVEELRDVAG